MNRPVAILGAGALGRLWAGYLQLGGVPAGFLPRPGTTPDKHLRYDLLDLAGRRHSLTLPWLKANATPQLVLVTTKAYDTLAALSPWLDQWPASVPLVLFQNGLGSQLAAAARWPQRPLLAASTTEGAHRPQPDLCIHAGGGQTWVGALTQPAAERLSDVIEQLQRTGRPVLPEPDIRRRLWQKLVINAGINPYTALLDCANGDILEAPLYLDTIDNLCHEISTLMVHEGLALMEPEDLRSSIETVARATAPNTSSMRADVHAGRPTEIDVINGYLVALGMQHNVPTEVNQMLANRVKALTDSPRPR